MNTRKRSAPAVRAPKTVRAQVRRQVRHQAFNDPRLRAVAILVQEASGRSARVSLGEAARAARYSPQHFSEFFHDRVGICFDTWEFALRMKHAEDLVVPKPWMHADAVASAVGYSDVSAFSRAFKRYAGINWRQLKRLTRECPGVAEELDAIGRLDHAYALAMLTQRSPNTAAMLLRLVEGMRALAAVKAAS